MKWFYKKERAPVLPVTEAQQQAIDERWAWLVETLGEEALRSRSVLVPDARSFPIAYDGSYESARQTMEIVCHQMKLNPAEIYLNLYAESGNKIGAGNRTIYLQTSGRTGGLFWGKNEEDGLYHIGLEQKCLRDPEGMVAVLAHELAHVKLLGQGLLEENDEPLTDLATVAYGLGIFNANACFRFHRDHTSWGYNQLGYLSQMEWGYALAKYAVMRGEPAPEWITHLTANVQSDFRNSVAFL